MTPEEKNELIRAATAVAARAYAPYSGFRVGAAVMASGGRIYTGANVENASFGLSLCAERAALAAARSAGEKAISAIAVVCIDRPTGAPLEEVLPCGGCRQWIQELAPEAEIIVAGHAEILRIEHLLPRPFRLRPPRT
jgi:cytidine deaminase